MRKLEFTFWLALLLAAAFPRPSAAQFQGYFAQQIITKTQTVNPVAATANFTMPNFGQAAHSLEYTWSAGTFGPCSIEIQGSQDGTTFLTLAVAPGPPKGGSAYTSFTYANGWFPFIRIQVDRENSDCTANGSLSFQYSGYQNPLPYNPTSQTVRIANVAGGGIATAAINAAGLGYIVNDVVSVTGGGGAGGTLTVTAIGGGGAVTGISITTAGHGYSNTVGAATAGGTGAGLTVNITVAVVSSSSAALPTEIASSPAILTGFECSNSNAGTAFLQIYSSATAPTLGSNILFELPLPAASFQAGTVSEYSYPGPPIQGTAQFWFAGVTSLGGSTPVATPLVCNAQINLRGPFTVQ